MKICCISSAALPAPAESYSGLENLVAECSLEFAKAGHEVTLVTTRGSSWAQNSPHKNLQVLETIPSSWETEAEASHHIAYRDLIHAEYVDGKSIVWDNTWFAYNYLIQQSFPNMGLLHTHHGMLGWPSPPPVKYPRLVGLSKAHALMISNTLKLPARYVYNGIRLPEKSELKKGDYLLSLNRISPEKGIHDSIDVAMDTRMPMKVVGDDTMVSDHAYVRRIIERCNGSGGLVEFYGLVDNETKMEMLKNCKAVISCPSPSWVEGFGLFAVEAMAYGKPVLATNNGGLTEIIQHGKSGYLCHTPADMKEYIPLIDKIDPVECRKRAEEFSIERMAAGYLELFTNVIERGDRW